MEELEKRLRGRATESDEAVQNRIRNAKRELEMAADYQFQVVNNDVDTTAKEICEILSRLGETESCTKN